MANDPDRGKVVVAKHGIGSLFELKQVAHGACANLVASLFQSRMKNHKLLAKWNPPVIQGLLVSFEPSYRRAEQFSADMGNPTSAEAKKMFGCHNARGDVIRPDEMCIQIRKQTVD